MASMGKKGKALIVALIAVVVIAVIVVACVLSSAANDPKSSFAGTWDLCEITSQDGESDTTQDSIQTLKDNGQESFLNLNEDGTAQSVLFSSSQTDGTWEASSTTEATLTLGETQTYTLSIADDKLSYEYGDRTWTYTRGEAKQASDYVAQKQDVVNDDSFKAVTVADDENVKIVAKKRYSDTYGDPGYEITVTNKGKHDITFVPADQFTVSGQQAAFAGSMQVKAGKKSTTFFYFNKEDVDGLDAMTGVSGTFLVQDMKNGKQIGEYEFSQE